MQQIRIETRTTEEAFEAFSQIMDAGHFPGADGYSDKLVVKSSREELRQSHEDGIKEFGSYRAWVVDYMTSNDATMDFFEDQGIDVEDELL